MRALVVGFAITVAFSLVTISHAQSRSAENMAVVGMMTRPYVDTSRMNWLRTGPRPLQTAIWYPVDSATRRETIFDGAAAEQIFVPVDVAPAATLSERSPKYPLVVMSHGTGGSAVMMMWLGVHLAANGYIVAAMNHHGNTSAEKAPAPQGFLLYWERATDLKLVIDALLRDPVLGNRIDDRRIGAAGFSLGGYTVIAAAGGRFSQSTFDGFCESEQRDFTCEPQNEFPEAPARFALLRNSDAVVRASLRRSGVSYQDRRIKAVFAIAPALGGGFTKRGLRPVNVPIHVVVGNGDVITPPRTNAERYASLIKGAKLTVLPGDVGHYTFLHECTPRGREVLPICRDAAGVNRRAVHQSVRELALIFFNSVLAEVR